MVAGLNRRSLLLAAAALLGAAGRASALAEIARSVARPALRLGGQPSRVRLRGGTPPHGAGPFRLLLEGIAAKRDPDVNYSIFLNLPEGAAPDPAGPCYVGRLSFFGRVEGEGGAGADPDRGERQAYDVTALVRDQLAAGRWPAEGPSVTLVPAGLVLPGGGRDTGSGDAGATVARVRLVSE
jgi:hypothetical protein